MAWGLPHVKFQYSFMLGIRFMDNCETPCFVVKHNSTFVDKSEVLSSVSENRL